MNTEHIICLILAIAFVGLALWIIYSNLRTVRRIDAELQRRRDRRTRLNARAPEHPLLFAPGVQIRINADGTLPEWIQIAPFGEWPTRDGRAVQRFHAEAAQQVISWFNFWPRRIARLAHIHAVKVWVGHPDFAPEEWPERIELGSITELSTDEQGLNARVSWAAGALTHVTQHRFPSVAWDCDEIAEGIEVPALLWSVGMWHKPNIKSVKPVINALSEEEDEEGDDLETEENAESEEDEDSIEDTETRRHGDAEMEEESSDKAADSKDAEMEEDSSDKAAESEAEQKADVKEEGILPKILAALKSAGITRDGDDENTVLGAVGSLIQSIAWRREETARQSRLATDIRAALHPIVDVEDMPDRYLPEQAVAQLNALVGERAAMKSLIATLSAERDLLHNSRVNSAIAQALQTGRITKADEEEQRTELNADFDQAFNRLSAFQIQLNSQPLNLGNHKPALMEAAERMTRLNAWLDDYQITHGGSRDAAWAASEADPQMRGIHEAMKAADRVREG